MGGREAEGNGLLNRHTGVTRIAGSNPAPSASSLRKGGRVVEGAPLERVYTGNRIESSNLSLSAMLF